MMLLKKSLRVLVMAAFSLVNATVVMAQTGNAAFNMLLQQDKTLQQALAAPTAVRIPSTDTIDTRTHSTVVHLANTSGDSVTVSFHVQDVDPSASDSLKGQSMKPSQSLVSWIHTVPGPIVLGPYEKRDVTLQVAVPANTKPGEYQANLMITTLPVLQGANVTVVADSTAVHRVVPGLTSKLVYRVKS